MRIVATEPTACPTLTRGPFSYDSGDVAMMTPLLAMHSLGHTFVPPPIHAGGLRYHGMAPLVSHTLREGLIEAQSLERPGGRYMNDPVNQTPDIDPSRDKRISVAPSTNFKFLFWTVVIYWTTTWFLSMNFDTIFKNPHRAAVVCRRYMNPLAGCEFTGACCQEMCDPAGL